MVEQPITREPDATRAAFRAGVKGMRYTEHPDPAFDLPVMTDAPQGPNERHFETIERLPAMGFAATERRVQPEDCCDRAPFTGYAATDVLEKVLQTLCWVGVGKEFGWVTVLYRPPPLSTCARSAAKSLSLADPSRTSGRGSHRSKIVRVTAVLSDCVPSSRHTAFFRKMPLRQPRRRRPTQARSGRVGP